MRQESMKWWTNNDLMEVYNKIYLSNTTEQSNKKED